MDRNTFDQTMCAFIHRNPFQWFTVTMADGQRLQVDHPDAIATRDGVALFVAQGGMPSITEHEAVHRIAVPPTDDFA